MYVGAICNIVAARGEKRRGQTSTSTSTSTST